MRGIQQWYQPSLGEPFFARRLSRAGDLFRAEPLQLMGVIDYQSARFIRRQQALVAALQKLSPEDRKAFAAATMFAKAGITSGH